MEGKCCDNCVRSRTNDMDSLCVRGYLHQLEVCDDVCNKNVMGINGWNEITPDNVDEVYTYNIYRIMIAVVDSKGNIHYTKYEEMSTNLNEMAKIGGCYYYVLPELRKEE